MSFRTRSSGGDKAMRGSAGRDGVEFESAGLGTNASDSPDSTGCTGTLFAPRRSQFLKSARRVVGRWIARHRVRDFCRRRARRTSHLSRAFAISLGCELSKLSAQGSELLASETLTGGKSSAAWTPTRGWWNWHRGI